MSSLPGVTNVDANCMLSGTKAYNSSGQLVSGGITSYGASAGYDNNAAGTGSTGTPANVKIYKGYHSVDKTVNINTAGISQMSSYSFDASSNCTFIDSSGKKKTGSMEIAGWPLGYLISQAQDSWNMAKGTAEAWGRCLVVYFY